MIHYRIRSCSQGSDESQIQVHTQSDQTAGCLLWARRADRRAFVFPDEKQRWPQYCHRPHDHHHAAVFHVRDVRTARTAAGSPAEAVLAGQVRPSPEADIPDRQLLCGD